MNHSNRIKQYPTAVRIVIGKLLEAGYSAYMVGGCVRDALLGREPHDWDVTTSAKPDEILKAFEAFRTIPTGLAHGTVTVLIDHLAVEVTTFRIDGTYTDSRHPDSVAFTDRLSEDLSRRDFTVNAMAYNETEGLIDLHGGQADLAAGVIRAVGDPETRFGEDALRILRAVRFAARLGFSIEPETRRALTACREGLSRVSAERIRDEFLKTLVCQRAGEGMELLEACGLVPYILPGLEKFGEGVNLRALELMPETPELRLAYLLRGLSPERAREVLGFLKPSTAFRSAVLTLREATLPETIDRPSARRFAAKYKELSEAALILVGMTAKDGETMESADVLMGYIEDARESGDCLTVDRLAVSGKELIAAGIPQSRRLGELLDYLLEQVLDDPARNDRDTLLSLALARYREQNP